MIEPKILLKVFGLAIFTAAFFAFTFTHPVRLDDDASQYDLLGRNLANHHGFSLSSVPPYEPTMLREPGYPIFLAILYRLFGHSLVIVQLFQILIFAAACALTVLLAYNIFGNKAANWAGLLTALSPALANYPSYMLSETVVTFFVCLLVFLLTIAAQSQKKIWFLLSGAVFGITILAKVTVLLFVVVAAIGIFLLKVNPFKDFKKSALELLIFVLPVLLIIAPWSYRNHHLFGTYQLSLRGGAALWQISQKLDDSPKEMLEEATFNFSEYLGNVLFPNLVQNPRDFILEGTKKVFEKEAELQARGFSAAEIDKLMRTEALSKIASRPFKFLTYIPIEFIKMTAFVYVPTLNEPHMIDKFYKLRYGRTLLSSIRGVFRLTAYPLLILVVMGIFFTRRVWRKWYFLLGMILYINLVYSMMFAYGRYAVILIPFYSIFAVAGFFALIGKKT